jgi:hypothetical protein
MDSAHRNEVLRRVRRLVTTVAANNARVQRGEMQELIARRSYGRAINTFKRFLKDLP